jgi:hypothetical protein
MRRQPFTDVRLDEARIGAILEKVDGGEPDAQPGSAENVKKKSS